MVVEAAVEKLDSIGNILHTVQHLEVMVTHSHYSSSTVQWPFKGLNPFPNRVVLDYFPVASQPVLTQHTHLGMPHRTEHHLSPLAPTA